MKIQTHLSRTRSVGALADVNAYGCGAEQAISAVTNITERNLCFNGTNIHVKGFRRRKQLRGDDERILPFQATVLHSALIGQHDPSGMEHSTAK